MDVEELLLIWRKAESRLAASAPDPAPRAAARAAVQRTREAYQDSLLNRARLAEELAHLVV